MASMLTTEERHAKIKMTALSARVEPDVSMGLEIGNRHAFGQAYEDKVG